jgi:hypothetical protein
VAAWKCVTLKGREPDMQTRSRSMELCQVWGKPVAASGYLVFHTSWRLLYIRNITGSVKRLGQETSVNTQSSK